MFSSEWYVPYQTFLDSVALQGIVAIFAIISGFISGRITGKRNKRQKEKEAREKKFQEENKAREKELQEEKENSIIFQEELFGGKVYPPNSLREAVIRAKTAGKYKKREKEYRSKSGVKYIPLLLVGIIILSMLLLTSSDGNSILGFKRTPLPTVTTNITPTLITSSTVTKNPSNTPAVNLTPYESHDWLGGEISIINGKRLTLIDDCEKGSEFYWSSTVDHAIVYVEEGATLSSVASCVNIPTTNEVIRINGLEKETNIRTIQFQFILVSQLEIDIELNFRNKFDPITKEYINALYVGNPNYSSGSWNKEDMSQAFEQIRYYVNLNPENECVIDRIGDYVYSTQDLDSAKNEVVSVLVVFVAECSGENTYSERRILVRFSISNTDSNNHSVYVISPKSTCSIILDKQVIDYLYEESGTKHPISCFDIVK